MVKLEQNSCFKKKTNNNHWRFLKNDVWKTEYEPTELWRKPRTRNKIEKLFWKDNYNLKLEKIITTWKYKHWKDISTWNSIWNQKIIQKWRSSWSVCLEADKVVNEKKSLVPDWNTLAYRKGENCQRLPDQEWLLIIGQNNCATQHFILETISTKTDNRQLTN